MLDTYGHHWGHTIVNIFDGQEYPEFGFDKDKMPVPNMIHIYEAWHWAPLQPSPKLHEKLLSSVGMVPDIGFYHQDGRAAFSQSHIDGITDYIENLTSLNGEAWKQIAQSIPLDARGFITTLAYFCHNHPSVAEVPNLITPRFRKSGVLQYIRFRVTCCLRLPYFLKKSRQNCSEEN
jgi:hypothetical protein